MPSVQMFVVICTLYTTKKIKLIERKIDMSLVSLIKTITSIRKRKNFDSIYLLS